MANLIYTVLLIPVMMTEYLYCYKCGTRKYDDGEDGIIESPRFPEPFPDGPYNCTYIITNPYGGDVLLEFTDFVTHSELHYSFGCREQLVITYVDRASTDYICEYMDVYQTRTGRSTMQVRFQVTGENLHGLPGFRAKYSMVSINYSLMNKLHGTIRLDVTPFEKGHRFDIVFTFLGNYTCTLINVVKAYPGYRVAWSFSGLEELAGHNGSEFTLEVRDGPTSMSPLIAEWTELSDVRNVYSGSEYLYIRFIKNYNSYYVPGSYIFFKETDPDPCPEGFFQCVNSGYCIGTSAVCDGTDHCGDNSDEELPFCDNYFLASCYGELPCVEDRADGCYIDSCSCRSGYGGEKCEYDNFKCPFSCQNGGSCYDYICHCTSEFSGDKCEIKNVCEPPCLNGGTCSHWGSCYCPSDYYGGACEEYYGDNNNSGSSGFGGLLSIILPFVVVITCIFVCVVTISRRSRRRTQTPTACPSATFHANGANDGHTVVYVDNPPAYQDVVTTNANDVASDEPDGDVDDQPTTPPPTYDSVAKPIARTPTTISEREEDDIVSSSTDENTHETF